MNDMKPLGAKSYGSIPHLIGSRMGPADRHAHAGQCRIVTEKVRDKHDKVFVHEKLDGGNVGVLRLSGKIHAITRAGYLAETSPYKTHHAFKQWVQDNEERFYKILNEGERICGEWMLTAVGTLYNLPHEPFVAFDLMRDRERAPMSEFYDRLTGNMTTANYLGDGPMSVQEALRRVIKSPHGAIETVEGAVWRVERKGKFDFMVKFVRPDKVDGKYLKEDVFNKLPKSFEYLKWL